MKVLNKDGIKSSSKGLLLVMISGVVYGIMPGAVKLCVSLGATKEFMAFMRCFVLCLCLLPFVLKQNDTFKLYKKHFFKLLLISAAGAVTPLLLFSAYESLETGLVTTVHYMFPAEVALLSLFILKEKLTARRLLCVVLCVVGVLLMFQIKGDGASVRGLAVAVLSSFTWSFYILLLKKFDLKDITSEQLVFYVAADSAFLTALYIAFAGGFPSGLTGKGLLAVVGFNIIIAICGSMFFVLGVRNTEAQTAAVASTLEPITSIAVGVLFLCEAIGARTGIGCLMILAAVVLSALKSGKEKNKV